MAKFIKSGRNDVGVYFDTFKGRDYVHIRNCYIDRDGNRGRTSKGVMVSIEVANEIFAALGEVLTAGPTGIDPFTGEPHEKAEPETKAKPKRKTSARAKSKTSASAKAKTSEAKEK